MVSRILKVLTLGLAVFFATELSAGLSLIYLKGRGAGIVYNPVYVDSSEYAAYLTRRHPVLGWTAASYATTDELDKTGARRLIPPFPDTTAPCISAYGDSFVWGDEVDSRTAWINQLAQKLQCPVKNFGVNGYGTDQAYLRYRENLSDRSPVVLLGLTVENIIRNVNRYRGLIYSGHRGPGFKPRFISENNAHIQLLSLPLFSYAEYLAAVSDPGRALVHEFFAPGGASGIVSMRWPYLFQLLRLTGNYMIQARLHGRQRYVDFFSENHPSRALGITKAIVNAFIQHAHERNQMPAVVIIPLCADFESYKKEKLWSYTGLTAGLKTGDATLVDLGERLLSQASNFDPRELYTQSCRGHFNAKGSQVVARITAAAVSGLSLRRMP